MEIKRKTFLSYSRVNKDFAVRLAKELKSEGFDIWLDQLDIPTGARWDDEVEKALEECEVFMVIMTPASSASENVKDEIAYALDSGKRILPILLENATLPLRLRRLQYVDFTGKGFDDGVELAKVLLRGLIDQTNFPRLVHQGGLDIKAEAERKTQEEAERLAKADDPAKLGAERKVQEKAERFAAQVSEQARLALQKENEEQAVRDSAAEVFISYAWGGAGEDIVNAIDKSLQDRGIKIVRDKRALGYRGSIKTFMERLGKGDCVIVVISDKYLRSPNCMFELVEIAGNKQFEDRIFPVVLSDADIYRPVQQIQYIKHWENEIKQLNKSLNGVGRANLQGIYDQLNLYDRIRDNISKLTAILSNMNALTPDMHNDTDFSSLYDAIVERLQKIK